MERHSENALKVAKYLESHEAVEWVSYAGSLSHPSHELAKKYLPKGQGAILTFGIKGGRAAGQKVIENVKLFSHLANVGDSKSLIIHPASTTHQRLTEDERLTAGVNPELRVCRSGPSLSMISCTIWVKPSRQVRSKG